MSNQEDFHRPEKLLEKTREIDNEARISNIFIIYYICYQL